MLFKGQQIIVDNVGLNSHLSSSYWYNNKPIGPDVNRQSHFLHIYYSL